MCESSLWLYPFAVVQAIIGLVGMPVLDDDLESQIPN